MMRRLQSVGRPQSRQSSAGFTLIEVMIVMVIIAILFALGSVNLGTPQSIASLASTSETLTADIKSQQLLAMTGRANSHGSSAQPQGIHFDSHSYTLFASSTYSPGDSDNFTVDTANGVALSTTLSGDDLLFKKGSGEVDNFDPAHNVITLGVNGSQKTITLNALGALDVQ